MRTEQPSPPLTIPAVASRKGRTPLVCLTAYTTPVARIVDRHCDIVLVGDSVGMVLHGLPSTLPVSVDMMVLHGQAVRRGLKRALMVVDLPFGSYEQSPQQAFDTAARIMAETGCAAVKLEGGIPMAETIAFLSARGIPVMAHVGLTPQSVHRFGGYGVRGQDEEAESVARDAAAATRAGAFAVVLEKIPAPLARSITDTVPVPTIGIGASENCDGQILVVDDILGTMPELSLRFVKRYATIGAETDEAVAAYADDVRRRRFPAEEHAFGTGASQDGDR
ncbi:3-methyl-2-oxobutanoate hydroxymethyltransferase [Fodinicurvata sp. EGI_FJ10296]|uniref:3-methyl-2-oxobutanoate hydroxymethyltransferase n=1 Tax=Fodinicurvata sp. EGI_FJ10296 TaxID=3231908 RepID=UPI0034544BC0